MCTCDARLRIRPNLRCKSAGVGNVSIAICAASAATRAHGEFGQHWLLEHRWVGRYHQNRIIKILYYKETELWSSEM